MKTVRGIYDGKSVQLLEKLADHRKYKVIVTFLEEIESTDDELREFTSQTTGLGFWNDPREDLYQDFLKQKEI